MSEMVHQIYIKIGLIELTVAFDPEITSIDDAKRQSLDILDEVIKRIEGSSELRLYGKGGGADTA